MLVDWQIKDYNLISPLNPDHVQPASVDLTLGNEVALLNRIFEDPKTNGGVHNREALLYVGTSIPAYSYFPIPDVGWSLQPGGFALFQTAETITLPPDISGKFEGKSSLGRIGLMTHITAGFVDPGFHGVLTLELYNCGPLTLVLRPGIKIGQIAFTQLGAIPERIYGDPELGSHYQDADTVQGGRFT